MMTENKQKLQIEQAKKCLLDFVKELEKIKQVNDKVFNIFNAIGMTTQEIRHSTFLAWLLNPEKPDNIKFDFLPRFLSDVYDYKSNGIANSEVIGKTSEFATKEELLKITEAPQVKVLTEYQLVNGADDGRIDIYLEIPQAKTFIVIENKTFTTSHDNQLSRYVKEFANSDWSKIFIYLTPKGELPTEEYENWCLYSYERINVILSLMLKDVQNRKLKYLIGDYINMIDMNLIKNNKELNALCKKIKREHSQALEILNSYTDNIEKAVNHCKAYLSANISGFNLVDSTRLNFSFYTQDVKEYFERHGENLFISDNILRCSGSVRCDDGPIKVGWGTGKKRDEHWTEAQLILMNEFAASKKHTEMYFTFPKDFCGVIMTSEQRGLDFDEILIENLNANLKKFADTINKFNERIKTL